jgi:hypothetical protein
MITSHNECAKISWFRCRSCTYPTDFPSIPILVVKLPFPIRTQVNLYEFGSMIVGHTQYDGYKIEHMMLYTKGTIYDLKVKCINSCGNISMRSCLFSTRHERIEIGSDYIIMEVMPCLD